MSSTQSDPANFTQPQLFLAEIYGRRGDNTGVMRELQELLDVRPEGPVADAIRRQLHKLQGGD